MKAYADAPADKKDASIGPASENAGYDAACAVWCLNPVLASIGPASENAGYGDD